MTRDSAGGRTDPRTSEGNLRAQTVNGRETGQGWGPETDQRFGAQLSGRQSVLRWRGGAGEQVLTPSPTPSRALARAPAPVRSHGPRPQPRRPRPTPDVLRARLDGGRQRPRRLRLQPGHPIPGGEGGREPGQPLRLLGRPPSADGAAAALPVSETGLGGVGECVNRVRIPSGVQALGQLASRLAGLQLWGATIKGAGT